MVLTPNIGRLQVPTLIGTMRLLDYSFLNRDVQSSPAYLNVKALPAEPQGLHRSCGFLHRVPERFDAAQFGRR